MPNQPPETGQIVKVRSRQWIAVDARASAPDVTTGGAAQHLDTLTSLDEDALGETLSVVWELEPGARIIEEIGLPKLTGFDSPDRLDAFLDAVRWGAAAAADRSLL
jgi:hypothetical protein